MRKLGSRGEADDEEFRRMKPELKSRGPKRCIRFVGESSWVWKGSVLSIIYRNAGEWLNAPVIGYGVTYLSGVIGALLIFYVFEARHAKIQRCLRSPPATAQAIFFPAVV
jgi:hypothetical protein